MAGSFERTYTTVESNVGAARSGVGFLWKNDANLNVNIYLLLIIKIDWVTKYTIDKNYLGNLVFGYIFKPKYVQLLNVQERLFILSRKTSRDK